MSDVIALRRALLELHRELLQIQRRQVEKVDGRMSAAETLQAAADDLRFSWLRTLSQLIVDLDAAIAGHEDAPSQDALVTRATDLLSPPDADTPFGRLYLRALQDHPEVVMAHRDVVSALTAT